MLTRSPESRGVTLLGSFKYKAILDQVADHLEKRGVPVLAPPRGEVIGETQNFRMLQVDAAHMDPVEAEFGYLKAAFSAGICN